MFVLSILCRRLGWEAASDEGHLDSMLRGELLSALVSFGHEETVNEAKRRFEAFLEDRDTPLLPADIRKVINHHLLLLTAGAIILYGHQTLPMIFHRPTHDVLTFDSLVTNICWQRFQSLMILLWTSHVKSFLFTIFHGIRFWERAPVEKSIILLNFNNYIGFFAGSIQSCHAECDKLRQSGLWSITEDLPGDWC